MAAPVPEMMAQAFVLANLLRTEITQAKTTPKRTNGYKRLTWLW
jgi:hypothetical protein